jgi:hypothetical protein
MYYLLLINNNHDNLHGFDKAVDDHKGNSQRANEIPKKPKAWPSYRE